VRDARARPPRYRVSESGSLSTAVSAPTSFDVNNRVIPREDFFARANRTQPPCGAGTTDAARVRAASRGLHD
jgi:hypothetical protein